jgi:hypothetical protein
MKTVLATSLIWVFGWDSLMLGIAQATPMPTDFMPYLDKVGTVGLALLVAYMMYKEMGRRERYYEGVLDKNRQQGKEERDKFHLKEEYLLKQLLDRLDEGRMQVNDLIKAIAKMPNDVPKL